MNNILTIKIFGDVEHKYGPYFRIGYRDKEATFNLLDKDRRPLTNKAIDDELIEALRYIEFGDATDVEMICWLSMCTFARDLYVEMRKNHE